MKITNARVRCAGRWLLGILAVLALIALFWLVLSMVPPHAGS